MYTQGSTDAHLCTHRGQLMLTYVHTGVSRCSPMYTYGSADAHLCIHMGQPMLLARPQIASPYKPSSGFVRKTLSPLGHSICLLISYLACLESQSDSFFGKLAFWEARRLTQLENPVQPTPETCSDSQYHLIQFQLDPNWATSLGPN